ncbi:MAG: SusC/RagA family TonB-linked outer membrane protein [Chitinophagaceae bacterium]|nr:SusC/RagA family TonB-linked outer membrane protein [Chitinophagaceae bacterium]
MLDRRPVTDISTALQGLVPGLQAKENLDGSMEFLIRGTSSIYASRSPLVVVDGFPISGSDFSTINPNDVETITVLKDAAAASIWGARSANGVIVITTKRPRVGRDKMTVEINAFTKIYNNIDLDQVMSQANSADHVRYERLAFDRQLFFTTPYSPSFANITLPTTLAQEFIFANKYNGYSTARMNASLDSLAQINNRGQLKDNFLRNGIVNQFSINLSGATERTKTYGSLLYESKKDGIIKKGYERYLMNFNNQFQATKYLTLVFGANVQFKKTESSGPDIGEMQNLSPYETLLNPNGSYSVNLNSYNREQMALLPLDKFPYSDWSYNLLREVRGRDITNEQISARIQAGINVKILKGVDFDSKLQYERNKTDFSNYQSDETFFVRNIANTNVVYNNTTRVVGTQYVPKGGILRANSSNLESYVIRNQLNVNRTVAGVFNVNAIVGNELSSYLTTTQTNPWVYGYFPDKNQSTVPPFGFGSTGNTFTNFRGTTGQTLSGGNTVFGWGKDKYVSFYGNAAITYRSKYTLSGSARSDASNYITDDPKLRWSPLWSVGGMWRMIDEDFMKNIGFVDNLVVRLTYGKNGNAEKTTSTKPLLTVGTSPNVNTGTIVASIADNGNPFLRWEKTTTTNLGIDFSMFKRRLFGKIDLYNKLGEDITGNIVLPATTGTTSQKFNNAEIINRGIELELGSDFRLGKVQWNTTMTYAYNWNRVNKLFYPSYLAFQLVDPSTPVEGRPVGPLYSYTFLGVKDSIPYVAGPKGVPYAMNAVQLHNTGLGLDFLNYEGTTVPPHTLGWVNNFNAYGFNLMIVIVGKFGGVYRDPVFNFPTFVGSAKSNVSSFVNEVFNGNPLIPQFPKYLEPQFYLWDRYTPNLQGLVESSSFLECKEIDFEYNLPAKMIRSLQISSLRIFSQVRDIGMIWHANKKGYNPEWLPGTQRPVTAFTFGINAKF